MKQDVLERYIHLLLIKKHIVVEALLVQDACSALHATNVDVCMCDATFSPQKQLSLFVDLAYRIWIIHNIMYILHGEK